ncbi:uncharacterized protein Tco025E_07608 [Trypanosoma conorhini]|uniref:Uncharacterized protein n=1 Tax=Trypanosoma conorhini TaxID=83891 RepID=A0A422NLG8_9TRYP|nr:uncharacterized protein Tco025E_07608 [Trypanosoma conorhini]RNF06313.1 hypothetical protein Tco025E_07608 [Trypanosoma conorhini]
MLPATLRGAGGDDWSFVFFLFLFFDCVVEGFGGGVVGVRKTQWSHSLRLPLPSQSCSRGTPSAARGEARGVAQHAAEHSHRRWLREGRAALLVRARVFFFFTVVWRMRSDVRPLQCVTARVSLGVS